MATIVRTPRAPVPPPPLALPLDVRAMNATAQALFVLAALGLVAMLAMWAMRQPVFTLRAIHVDGEVMHNSEATIRANAGPKLAGNFFTMDLKAAQRAFESVPWVRHAIVRRVWPDRLLVSLEEHRVAALWSPVGSEDDADDKLVNTHGEVFEVNLGDVEDDELPTLSGPAGSAAEMLEALHRLQPLYARIERRIDTLTQSNRGSWRVEFDGGGRVELGRGTLEELLARSERFVETVGPIAQRYQRPLEYADLRHQDGYALRLRGVSTTLTAAEKKSSGN
ncbi:cell division protein FtsQ/DivIB [Piscinibacter sakaiensis]|uniref:Cell division protein FtsQ n=1 Tax=Piscinibacter sakaiensis TaxID=1547922 RepID=A0A0K8P4L5_PISS1|nr:cell division protein FtsQ/DivIB [Piscinibacter sakaiensis]GAP37105.1 cell division protein FtsQ [Piscinibacter sakaiensis]